jgi:hypothetical protein
MLCYTMVMQVVVTALMLVILFCTMMYWCPHTCLLLVSINKTQ